MTDIVERLRDLVCSDTDAWHLCGEAADEIERLRDALRYMVENPEDVESFWQIARAALGEGK